MDPRLDYAFTSQPPPPPRLASGPMLSADALPPRSATLSSGGLSRPSGPVPSGAWYNLSMDRDRAVAHLAGKPSGTFIVRGRSNPGTVLVNHLLIRKLAGPPIRFAMDAGTEDQTIATANKYASLTALLSSLDYLDQRVVTPVPDYFEEPWYWGDLHPQDAAKILLSQNSPPGLFLGRYYSRGFAITTTISRSEVAHIYVFEPPPPSFARTPKRKTVLSQLRLGQLPTNEMPWKSFCSGAPAVTTNGSESWRDEFKKYSHICLTPFNRPSDVNPIPMKLLWACSHGLVELAYQLIMREGTSRTTKTKIGWSPLNEIMRFMLTVPTPFPLEKGGASPEMTKLQEIARMIAGDGRIDVSMRAIDEIKKFHFDCEWDDTVQGYSPFSMCLQSYSHFNAEMLAILLSRGTKPDGLALLAMVKSRYFRMYRDWIVKLPLDSVKPFANQILFSLLETLSYAPVAPPSNKRLDHASLPEESQVDQETIQHAVETLGADINAVMRADLDGKGLQEVTPLILAARGCSVVTCAYLVESGVELTKKIATPPVLLANMGAGATTKMSVIDVCDFIVRNPSTGTTLDDSYGAIVEYFKLIRKRFHIK